MTTQPYKIEETFTNLLGPPPLVTQESTPPKTPMFTPTKTLEVTSQVSQTAKILTPPREMQTPDTTTDILEENMNFIPQG